MSFSSYHSYKCIDSYWTNALPEGWALVSLKWISSIYSGGTPDKQNFEYWENGTVPWINSGAVNQELVTEPSRFITEEALEKSSAKWVPKDAIVMALAGQGKTKGMVAQLGIRTTCNQSMAAIVPVGWLDSRYLFWWLASNYQNIRNLSGGDLRDGLNLDLLGSISTPMPSEIEQTQIARFLDCETTRIDTLISEQQRLIELLKEKRQAVISHAVTKGLDPTVPIKDSGVEWLGDVPAHWEVRKASYIGSLFGSEAVPDESVTDLGDLPFLKVSSLSQDGIEIKALEFFVDSQVARSFRLKKKFIVFPKRGAAIFLNKVNVVNFPALLDPNLMGWEINSGYELFYFAHALKCRGLKELADVSTVPQINNKHIAPEKFPLPPTTEQKRIVEFLDAQLSNFDGLIKEAESGVSLLQERRSALISAAVIGKIDVRNWQPPTDNKKAKPQPEAMHG